MFELISKKRTSPGNELYVQYYLLSYENVNGEKITFPENYIFLDSGELYCDILSLLTNNELLYAAQKKRGLSLFMPYRSYFTHWLKATLQENAQNICIAYETFLLDFIKQIDLSGDEILNYSPTSYEMKLCKSISSYPDSGERSHDITHMFFKNASDFLAYDFFYLFSRDDKKRIRKCAGCGKYFVPGYRSDEIYCKNLYKPFISCQDYGYQSKIDASETLTAYRTIYKTQNMRLNRKKKSFPEHSKERSEFIHTTRPLFDAWLEYAKNQLALCQNGDISLEEMKKRISKSDWLEGVNYADNNET